MIRQPERISEHGAHCAGCRELSLVNAIREIERLCLDGYAFENPHPVSGGKGRDVVAVEDVMAILNRLPAIYRGPVLGAEALEETH